MCVVSMVHDYYQPKFPQPEDFKVQPFTITAVGGPVVMPDLDELRKLIEDFKQATAAAKKVDALTGQPDCVDPEKAKLEERVERLERVIDALLKDREARP